MVVGAINIDTVASVAALPLPGETRIASEMSEHLGGKGQAQAIAAARFGSACEFIAAAGEDAGGARARRYLDDAGVDIALVRTSARPTGRAIVLVDAHGENSIVIEPGANGDLRSLSAADRAAISQADVLLAQLEVHPGLVFEAIALAHDAGVTVILNAAPASALPVDVLDQVDFLIVNEVECLQLGGARDVDTAARSLARNVGTVIVTLGGAGGRLYCGDDAPLALATLTVEPVDTTGAGDTFCGVFAAAIAQHLTAADAFQLGLVAGSLATLAPGNATAIPDRAAVLTALRTLA